MNRCDRKPDRESGRLLRARGLELGVGHDLVPARVLGVMVASIFSGIGSIAMGLIRRVSGPPASVSSGEPPITKAILDARTKWILEQVKAGTETLVAKVEALEKESVVQDVAKATTPVKVSRKKTPTKAVS